MTDYELRDHYAGLAMQAMVAQQGSYLAAISGEDFKDAANMIAGDALMIAEAMLRERQAIANGLRR